MEHALQVGARGMEARGDGGVVVVNGDEASYLLVDELPFPSAFVEGVRSALTEHKRLYVINVDGSNLHLFAV